MIRSSIIVTALVFVLLGPAALVHSRTIDECGAVANDTSLAAALRNGHALFSCFEAANNDLADRSVIVPAGSTYTMLPYAPIDGVHNIVFSVKGVLSAYTKDFSKWPNNTHGEALNMIQINHCSNVSFNGGGEIDGHGYPWWWFVFLSGEDNRPHLFQSISCIGFLLEHVTFRNSPMYHVYFYDALDVVVQHVTVHVDVEEQRRVLQHFGYLSERGLPIFPLNTDGIDVRGRNVIVRDCDITNFDDAVCIKPLSGSGNLSQCSSNVTFEDIRIKFSVGASTGSVPPSTKFNCIRNITFRRITFDHPIKAIYVKPNPCPNGPAVDGTGIISDIVYEDITAKDTLYWSVWVSTQQQKQPGKNADTGCSWFYPLPGTKCPVYPCVPVHRLTLRNIKITGAYLSPGVMRCHPKGPCTGFHFENVTVTTRTGFPFGDYYLCEAIENSTFVNSTPLCKNTTSIYP